MQALFLLLILPLSVLGQDVLISYFEPFGGSSVNNSELIAKALKSKGLNSAFCRLNTVYDKSYAQLENCLRRMPQRPLMVISLGETGCQLKVESLYLNEDYNRSPDNEGNVRNHSVIVPGSQKHVSSRYPLPLMYCALSQERRNAMKISRNAGTFICNHVAFQMSHYYPEIIYGFIHVPSNRCTGNKGKVEDATNDLELMIKKAVAFLKRPADFGLPHPSNDKRLPETRDEVLAARERYRGQNSCFYEYYLGLSSE